MYLVCRLLLEKKKPAAACSSLVRCQAAPAILRMRSARSTAHLLFFVEASPRLTYTLSLHDALPISFQQPGNNFFVEFGRCNMQGSPAVAMTGVNQSWVGLQDRKSTRLNSSHRCISYAVSCWKKKSRQRLAHRLCAVKQLRPSCA